MLFCLFTNHYTHNKSVVVSEFITYHTMPVMFGAISPQTLLLTSRLLTAVFSKDIKHKDWVFTNNHTSNETVTVSELTNIPVILILV